MHTSDIYNIIIYKFVAFFRINVTRNNMNADSLNKHN